MYIVFYCEYVDPDDPWEEEEWEVAGVFDTKEKADKAVKDIEGYDYDLYARIKELTINKNYYLDDRRKRDKALLKVMQCEPVPPIVIDENGRTVKVYTNLSKNDVVVDTKRSISFIAEFLKIDADYCMFNGTIIHESNYDRPLSDIIGSASEIQLSFINKIENA